jgi:hypothetical protein
MFKRQISMMVLVGFATVMVVILMLDDPASKQAEMLSFSATQQAQRENVLFAELQQSPGISGLDVLDVTTGKGILVMRDTAGLWYAPAILNTQTEIPTDQLDQTIIERAATAILLFTAEQRYDATPENLTLFGLQPEPDYRVRFRAQDSTGQWVESVLDIGDTNPDRVAYYVYVNVESEQDRYIYLINKQTVDIVLTMLTDSFQVIPTLDAQPTASEVATPVP